MLITYPDNSSFFICYDFRCDSVVAYEVVPANGAILDMTVSAYRNLFKALGGESHNFDVVTFRVRTFQPGDVLGENIYYQTKTFVDQQLKALNDFAGENDDDSEVAAQMSINFFPSIRNIFAHQLSALKLIRQVYLHSSTFDLSSVTRLP